MSRLRRETGVLLPYPGMLASGAVAALLLALPWLDAAKYEGYRADLRTVTTVTGVLLVGAALVLAVRHGARPPVGYRTFPARLAFVLVATGVLGAGYLAAGQLLHRVVMPVDVDGPPGALPARILTLALLAAAFGVGLGALGRALGVGPVVTLPAATVLLAVAELATRWSGAAFGPLSATRFWLYGRGVRHDDPGCVSDVPAECARYTFHHGPAGLTLTAVVLTVVAVGAAVTARRPEDPVDPPPRRLPGRGRYAIAAGVALAGLVLAPVVVGVGAEHATSRYAVSGPTLPVDLPHTVEVPRAGRLAVYALGPAVLRDCRAVAENGSTTRLSLTAGPVRYGDSVSYQWLGIFHLPVPGRYTVTCGGDRSGEYLLDAPPRVEGVVGRLIEAPRAAGHLLGALPGLLLAAHAALRRHGRARPAPGTAVPAP